MESLMYTLGLRNPVVIESQNAAAGESLEKGIPARLLIPGSIYEASVLQQENNLSLLKIDGQVYSAEIPDEIQLPGKVKVEFLGNQDGEALFRLLQGASSSSKSYTLEVSKAKIFESLKSFIPEMNSEQMTLFGKTLPALQGDLFQNLVIFTYLYNLDQNKVRESVSRLQGGKVAPDQFRKALGDILQKLTAEIQNVSSESMRETLAKVIKLVSQMDRKTAIAGHTNIFVDTESGQLKDVLRSLCRELGLPEHPYLEDLHPAGKTETGREDIKDKLSTGARSPLAHAEEPGARQRGSTSIKDIRTALQGENVGLDKITDLKGDKKEVPGTSLSQGHLGGLKEYVQKELNLNAIIQKVYSAPDEKGQIVFLWSSGEGDSVLRNLMIEEKGRGQGKERSREYRIILDLDFIEKGGMQVILTWADNALQCRMLCTSRSFYDIITRARSSLEERMKHRDIVMNMCRIELEEKTG